MRKLLNRKHHSGNELLGHVPVWRQQNKTGADYTDYTLHAHTLTSFRLMKAKRVCHFVSVCVNALQQTFLFYF